MSTYERILKLLQLGGTLNDYYINCDRVYCADCPFVESTGCTYQAAEVAACTKANPELRI